MRMSEYDGAQLQKVLKVGHGTGRPMTEMNIERMLVLDFRFDSCLNLWIG